MEQRQKDCPQGTEHWHCSHFLHLSVIPISSCKQLSVCQARHVVHLFFVDCFGRSFACIKKRNVREFTRNRLWWCCIKFRLSFTIFCKDLILQSFSPFCFIRNISLQTQFIILIQIAYFYAYRFPSKIYFPILQFFSVDTVSLILRVVHSAIPLYACLWSWPVEVYNYGALALITISLLRQLAN